MKIKNGTAAAGLIALTLSMVACSAKVESIGTGPAPQPDHLQPVSDLLAQLQGTWRGTCETLDAHSVLVELHIDGKNLRSIESTYQTPDCKGDAIVADAPKIVLSVGVASAAVAGAYEIDFDLGGATLLNLVRVDGDTLYLGEANLVERPTELKMNVPFTRIR